MAADRVHSRYTSGMRWRHPDQRLCIHPQIFLISLIRAYLAREISIDMLGLARPATSICLPLPTLSVTISFLPFPPLLYDCPPPRHRCSHARRPCGAQSIPPSMFPCCCRELKLKVYTVFDGVGIASTDKVFYDNELWTRDLQNVIVPTSVWVILISLTEISPRAFSN